MGARRKSVAGIMDFQRCRFTLPLEHEIFKLNSESDSAINVIGYILLVFKDKISELPLKIFVCVCGFASEKLIDDFHYDRRVRDFGL